MTGRSSSASGEDRAGDEFEAALTSYAGFLGHGLAEVLVLLSPSAGDAALAAARSRLERMVADLRDLAPAPVAEPERVDLAVLAGEVARELSAPGSQARLVAGHAVMPVAGDPGLLRALLAHLMRLGLAASGSGVRFVLRTDDAGEGRVRVGLLEEGSADGDSERLTPFRRQAGSGPLLGAGVGGPAAARIVAAHGGRLAMRATDAGLLTEFDLPAATS